MIDKVVNSIIEAEECAKSMILDAEKNASDILAETDVLIEQENKKASEDGKAYYAEQINGYRKSSQEAAQKSFDDNKQSIEKEIKAYRANINAAVKKIVGNL